MNFIRFLLISIYSTALGMHMSLGVFMSSWDFIGPHLCYTSVILCLAFYIANKALVYIFLIERIHQLREIARRVDFVWSVGVVIILAGFGTIAVFAFLDPVHDLSSIDGKCRIGLRSKATIFLLAYDVGTNIVLTGIFVFQSYKWVEDLPFEAQLKTLTSFIPNALGRLPPTTTVRDFRVQLGHVMMSKSLVGAIAVTIPTLTNLIILYTLGGHERGWLCFTTCTIDGISPSTCLFPLCPNWKADFQAVTWSVIVVHWLTSHPAVDLVDNPIGQRASTHLPGGSGEYHEMS